METTKVTDEQLKEQGAKLVVGMSGLQNKTPDWISKIANGIIFIAMAWALFSPMMVEIPEEVSSNINRWLLISTGLIKLASKFFGFKLPEGN